MVDKMKAWIFYKPFDMRLEEVEIPKLDEDEILIKVRACGVCGSDVSYYTGHSKTDVEGGAGPLILGHEICGEIVQMGRIARKMTMHQIGDRVVVNPLVACNSCPECAKGHYNLCDNLEQIGVSVNGGFAQYCKVPYANLIRIPDEVSFEEGALTEPLVCANYGIKKLDIGLGDFVVIIGSGGIGLLMVQLAKARGAGKVALIGVVDYQLEMGKKQGADYIINSLDQDSPYYSSDVIKEIGALTGGRMADRVIVPTSAMTALAQAVDISGKGSRIVFFGLPGEKDVLPLNINQAIRKNQTIEFSWLGPLMWPLAVKETANELVKASDIVSHVFEFEEAKKALELMAGPETRKVKTILRF